MSQETQPARTRAQILVRALGAVAGGALALFHLWLFAGRLSDLSIAEPQVLASWLASAGLVLFAWALKRRGHSLAGGRSGLVFWILVLLLHVGMTPGALDPSWIEPAPGVAFALAALTLALVGLLAPPRGSLDAARPTRTALRSAAALALAAGPFAAPRPPPAR